MKYTVTLDTAIVAEGLVADGDVTPVLKQLPSGRYSLVFAPVDSAMADQSAPCQTVLYRPQDEVCPVAKTLWMPSATSLPTQMADSS